MLCTVREVSMKNNILNSLLRRAELDTSQRSLVEDMLWRDERGFEGEQRADKFWEELVLAEPHFLFHNYESENGRGYSYQIDTILLTKRFILVVELKNIGGVISYDERTHQFVRTMNGEQLALTDPFAQVSRHEDFIERLLWGIGVDLPIVTAVIVTSSSSILVEMPVHFNVFKLAGLQLKMKAWLDCYPLQISESMLCLVKDELLKRYKPRKWQHPFGDLALRQGVLCECGRTMKYERGKFICLCGLVSRSGLSQGLHDYRLLVNEWITSKQFREFFFIESKDIANKILKRSGFYCEGSTKGRRYLIPKDVWRK